MTVTLNPDTTIVSMTALPDGPITEYRWYRTRTGPGLLVTFRRTREGAPVVTFSTRLAGKLRRLRVVSARR